MVNIFFFGASHVTSCLVLHHQAFPRILVKKSLRLNSMTSDDLLEHLNQVFGVEDQQRSQENLLRTKEIFKNLHQKLGMRINFDTQVSCSIKDGLLQSRKESVQRKIIKEYGFDSQRQGRAKEYALLQLSDQASLYYKSFQFLRMPMLISNSKIHSMSPPQTHYSFLASNHKTWILEEVKRPAEESRNSDKFQGTNREINDSEQLFSFLEEYSSSSIDFPDFMEEQEEMSQKQLFE